MDSSQVWLIAEIQSEDPSAKFYFRGVNTYAARSLQFFFPKKFVHIESGRFILLLFILFF